MKEILNSLFRHQTLTREDSRELLVNLAEGKYNNSQVTAFLTVFQLRNITVDELSGFRDALLELCIKIDLGDFETTDLCGTGGDGKDTFNISTLASFIVAGTGEKVVKHGNYGVSSTCGSSNILEHFGYRFTNDRDILCRQVDEAGICFLHAPLFNPAMKNIAPIRRELSVKTFFNMLGPMVNPASPPNQLIGVYNLELARIYNYIYQASGRRYAIVHSFDGYDELSLTGDMKILTDREEYLAGPDDFGFETVKPEELRGGSNVADSAKIFSGILEGNGTPAQANVVLANAGMAYRVIHPEISLDESIGIVRLSLESGKALGCFRKLVSN
jgi:anthranilate phosphoribosyltransferase